MTGLGMLTSSPLNAAALQIFWENKASECLGRKAEVCFVLLRTEQQNRAWGWWVEFWKGRYWESVFAGPLLNWTEDLRTLWTPLICSLGSICFVLLLLVSLFFFIFSSIMSHMFLCRNALLPLRNIVWHLYPFKLFCNKFFMQFDDRGCRVSVTVRGNQWWVQTSIYWALMGQLGAGITQTSVFLNSLQPALLLPSLLPSGCPPVALFCPALCHHPLPPPPATSLEWLNTCCLIDDSLAQLQQQHQSAYFSNNDLTYPVYSKLIRPVRADL